MELRLGSNWGMKPVLQLKTFLNWHIAGLLLASILSTGCSLTDSLPGSKQLKDFIPGGGDEQQQPLTVGDLTVPNGMNYLKVESIGLVTGLKKYRQYSPFRHASPNAHRRNANP